MNSEAHEYEYEFGGTPPDILEQAARTTDNLLPQKSKVRYETIYNKFMNWRKENNVHSFSENVLMAYFGQITNQFKPSSLWAVYSMLRSVLIIKNNVNIADYPKLKASLKRQSDGFRSKKSKALTGGEINKFIHDAPDRQYLLMKTVVIIGISGACRKQELKNLKVIDVEDSGNIHFIKIPDTKTKIHRSFVVSGAFYKICKQYMEIRQQVKEPNSSQFFLNYQRGRCTKQVVGTNKLGNVPKQIAEYLKLPNPAEYPGHCFRRSSATILVDAGGDLMALKRHGGWRSSATAEGYVDNSLSNKTSTANKIMQSIELNETSVLTLPSNKYSITNKVIHTTENIENYSEVAAASSTLIPSTSTSVLESSGAPITFNNCHNITINYIQKQ